MCPSSATLAIRATPDATPRKHKRGAAVQYLQYLFISRTYRCSSLHPIQFKKRVACIAGIASQHQCLLSGCNTSGALVLQVMQSDARSSSAPSAMATGARHDSQRSALPNRSAAADSRVLPGLEECGSDDRRIPLATDGHVWFGLLRTLLRIGCFTVEQQPERSRGADATRIASRRVDRSRNDVRTSTETARTLLHAGAWRSSVGRARP
jgi:hypothetical protein